MFTALMRVVYFPLLNGVFLPYDHGLDFLHQLIINSTNQKNALLASLTVFLPSFKAALYTIVPRSPFFVLQNIAGYKNAVECLLQ